MAIFEDLGNGKVKVSGECVITGESISFEVKKVEYEQWQNGTPLQFAMPNTSADLREFILSGIGPRGWQLMEEDANLESEKEEVMS